jgi:hypothetical protein
MYVTSRSELLRWLLARGLYPNRPDWLGRNLLHGYAENGDLTVGELFPNAGADMNARGLEFHDTPSPAAIRFQRWCEKDDLPELRQRRRRLVEHLLKRGAATSFPRDGAMDDTLCSGAEPQSCGPRSERR